MTKYNPEIHHRRSIRLKGYDYAQPGLYFITICTKDRQHLFGSIENGRMIHNRFGEIAHNEWIKTAEIRDNVEILEFVIMPNHMHGIILLEGAYGNTPLQAKFQSPSKTIGAIVRGYKGTVTKQINVLRQMPGVPVWQRNYYEHIIRNEISYHRIAEYIINNPLKWQDDRFHAQNSKCNTNQCASFPFCAVFMLIFNSLKF